MDPANLAELERRTYRAVCDDGLVDILLGLYLLLLGLAVSLDPGGKTALFAAVAATLSFPAWRTLRKAVVEPRVGYVKLNAARAAKLRRRPLLVFALVFLIIAAAIWLSHVFGEGLPLPELFPWLLFAIPLAAMALLFEIPRFLAYAGVLTVERALDYAAGGPYEFLYWPAGIVIVGAGWAVLARFLRRYPIQHSSVNADA